MGNEFSLFEVNGQIVFQSEIKNQKSAIGVDGIASGIYFYQLEKSSNGILKSGKLVVNH